MAKSYEKENCVKVSKYVTKKWLILFMLKEKFKLPVSNACSKKSRVFKDKLRNKRILVHKIKWHIIPLTHTILRGKKETVYSDTTTINILIS